MKRREFIAAIGGAALTGPRVACAQDRVHHICALMAYAEGDTEGQAYMTAFRGALQSLGWSEGRNLRIDARWTGVDLDAMRRSAKELVSLKPESILAANTPTTAALLRETRSIPIVFATAADPLGSGFVASYARPGGNATGFTVLEGSMGGKWLEMLKEIAPRVNRAAFLYNPGTAPFEYFLGPFKTAAAPLKVRAIEAPVRDSSELETVIAAQAREANSGLVVMPGPFAPRTALRSPRSRRATGCLLSIPIAISAPSAAFCLMGMM